MSHDKPDLKVVASNGELTEEAEESQLYSTASLQGHKFSGKALLDAVDVLDRGSREHFPANDLKDVGMKLSILGMAESHIKRLGRLDRAMNLIEQQLATPDRLAQMPSNELAKLYRLLGTSMEVSQKYVKESLWSVNIGELQEQITELMAGGGSSTDDSDHSTKEVVADIFRRVSTMNQSFPAPQDGMVPEINPEHLPNDLLQEDQRIKVEEARMASHNAMLDEARKEQERVGARRPKGSAPDTPPVEGNTSPINLKASAQEGRPGGVAGLTAEELDEVMAEELGESAPLDLTAAVTKRTSASVDDWDELDDDDDDDAWDDAVDGKDDPLAGVDLKF